MLYLLIKEGGKASTGLSATAYNCWSTECFPERYGFSRLSRRNALALANLAINEPISNFLTLFFEEAHRRHYGAVVGGLVVDVLAAHHHTGRASTIEVDGTDAAYTLEHLCEFQQGGTSR